MASLTKWLSVRLRTKWLWVRIPLLLRDMIVTYSKKLLCCMYQLLGCTLFYIFLPE